MSAHTPGPWTARGTVVSCPKGVVVEVVGYPDETREEHEAVRADARLIAAAPDLLAALEELVRVREKHGGPSGRVEGSDGRYTRARAAIAKARGQR